MARSRAPLRIGNLEWTPSGLGAAIQAALPELEAHTETVDAATAIDRVRRDTLTAALTQVPQDARGRALPGALGHAPIVSEPVWVALAPAHPLAAEAVVSLEQLAGSRWARHVSAHWFHEVEERLFARVGSGAPR